MSLVDGVVLEPSFVLDIDPMPCLDLEMDVDSGARGCGFGVKIACKSLNGGSGTPASCGDCCRVFCARSRGTADFLGSVFTAGSIEPFDSLDIGLCGSTDVLEVSREDGRDDSNWAAIDPFEEGLDIVVE